MMKWVALCTLVLCTVPSSVRAQAVPQLDETGVRLLKECEAATAETAVTNSQAMDAMYCLGYLTGVVDTYQTWQSIHDKFHTGVWPPACVPYSATRLEFAKVVVKWLNDHPNRLHENYGLLVEYAFMDAYPCPKPKAP